MDKIGKELDRDPFQFSGHLEKQKYMNNVTVVQLVIDSPLKQGLNREFYKFRALSKGWKRFLPSNWFTTWIKCNYKDNKNNVKTTYLSAAHVAQKLGIATKNLPKDKIQNLISERIIEKAPDIESDMKACLPEKDEIIEPLEEDPRKWFDNEEIDNYFRFLADKYPDKITFPPFMTGISIDVLKRELFEHTLNQETDTPICLCIKDRHWGLVYINRTKKEVQFYDSLMNYRGYEDIMDGLSELAENLGFTATAKIKKQLQQDDYQCGAWVCYFLKELVENPDVDFNQLDVSEAQEIVAHHRKVVNETLSYVARKREEKRKRADSFFTQTEMNEYIRHLHKETNAFQEPKETPTPLTFDTIADKIRSDLESEIEKKNLVYPIQVYDRFWTILYIDRALGTIEYYDSKVWVYDDAPTKLSEIAQFLQNNDKKEFTVQQKISTYFCDEIDDHQTGPWALYFLENRLNNPDFNPNTDDPEAASNHRRVAIKFRKKIYKTFEATLA